jgi:hypothetical protein
VNWVSSAHFFSAAHGDLVAAIDWYESQRAGLGTEFIDAIDAAVAAVLDNPKAYPVVYPDAILGTFLHILSSALYSWYEDGDFDT